MARKSHPGGAETYWESELSKARDRAAAMDGLAARVLGLVGAGPGTVVDLERWCDEESKRRRNEPRMNANGRE